MLVKAPLVLGCMMLTWMQCRLINARHGCHISLRYLASIIANTFPTIGKPDQCPTEPVKRTPFCGSIGHTAGNGVHTQQAKILASCCIKERVWISVCGVMKIRILNWSEGTRGVERARGGYVWTHSKPAFSGVVQLLWPGKPQTPSYNTVTSQWARWRLKSSVSRYVYSTVCSGTDQRKHQSSVSLAFVRGIHRWPVNSPHKSQKRGKCFHLMTSSWCTLSTHTGAQARI